MCLKVFKFLFQLSYSIQKMTRLFIPKNEEFNTINHKNKNKPIVYLILLHKLIKIESLIMVIKREKKG